MASKKENMHLVSKSPYLRNIYLVSDNKKHHMGGCQNHGPFLSP